MGVTKRKFSFASLRLKTSSTHVEAGPEYDIDTSPPYSPTPSEMERPNVHPQLLLELRQVCTIIVNETNPPDPDEEPDHRETMRKFEEERQAKLAAQAAQARAAEAMFQNAEANAEAKTQRSLGRVGQRNSERIKKEYARKVEAETQKMIAREAEPERRKVLERQAELRMGSTADAIGEQPRKEQPRRYSTRRPAEDVPSSDRRSQPRVAIPKGAAAAFEESQGARKASETYRPTLEPLEPTQTKVSSKAKGKQKENDPPKQRQLLESRSATKLELLPPVHATIVNNTRAKQKEAEEPILNQIRASMHERPKTSAAATVDYDGPSYGSSKSTSRSNTEYENSGRPTSTAVTSAVFTPGDDKRTSYNRQPSVDSFRQSDDSYGAGAASAQARIWQEQKEAIRRAEEKYHNSGRAARPASKASKRSLRRWGNDGESEDERPLSRAGSLSESIRSSINYYIRPRASQDSMRSGRSSALGLSRSESRSSSMSRRSNSGWWRGGGLRRKGSWASFRSSRPDHDEPSKLRKNGEPNLNRPLPALPGLDQYKETKTHIGQLMKAGTRGRKKDKTKKPDAAEISQPQNQMQDRPPARHVKKDSISNPTLRNSSMDRTLHRYRESKIMQEPPQSQKPARKEPPAPINTNSLVPREPTPASANRKESTTSPNSCLPTATLARSHSHTSHKRTSNPLSLKSPTKLRRGSSQSSQNKPPPPMIRGPSWQKELETAVYPRPMDVNKGGAGEPAVREVISPEVVMLDRDRVTSPRPDMEKKGGLKGRVGRIFGGRDVKVVNEGRARRSMAAAR
ncbi:hypothetical protein ACLMJK_002925 [Lecanora helva]